MAMTKSFSINKNDGIINSHIFIIDDPNVEVKINRDYYPNITIDVTYKFDSELLFEFIFFYENSKVFRQTSLSMSKIDSETIINHRNTTYSDCMIDDFVESKMLVYNGSIYKLLEL